MATTVFSKPSVLTRQFYDSTTTLTLDLTTTTNGVFVVWSASSTVGTLGGMMDSSYGCVILVSNGKFGVVHKGTNITISVSSDVLTVTSTTAVAMGCVQF